MDKYLPAHYEIISEHDSEGETHTPTDSSNTSASVEASPATRIRMKSVYAYE